MPLRDMHPRAAVLVSAHKLQADTLLWLSTWQSSQSQIDELGSQTACMACALQCPAAPQQHSLSRTSHASQHAMQSGPLSTSKHVSNDQAVMGGGESDHDEQQHSNQSSHGTNNLVGLMPSSACSLLRQEENHCLLGTHQRPIGGEQVEECIGLIADTSAEAAVRVYAVHLLARLVYVHRCAAPQLLQQQAVVQALLAILAEDGTAARLTSRKDEGAAGLVGLQLAALCLAAVSPQVVMDALDVVFAACASRLAKMLATKAAAAAAPAPGQQQQAMPVVGSLQPCIPHAQVSISTLTLPGAALNPAAKLLLKTSGLLPLLLRSSMPAAQAVQVPAPGALCSAQSASPQQQLHSNSTVAVAPDVEEAGEALLMLRGQEHQPAPTCTNLKRSRSGAEATVDRPHKSNRVSANTASAARALPHSPSVTGCSPRQQAVTSPAVRDGSHASIHPAAAAAGFKHQPPAPAAHALPMPATPTNSPTSGMQQGTSANAHSPNEMRRVTCIDPATGQSSQLWVVPISPAEAAQAGIQSSFSAPSIVPAAPNPSPPPLRPTSSTAAAAAAPGPQPAASQPACKPPPTRAKLGQLTPRVLLQCAASISVPPPPADGSSMLDPHHFFPAAADRSRRPAVGLPRPQSQQQSSPATPSSRPDLPVGPPMQSATAPTTTTPASTTIKHGRLMRHLLLQQQQQQQLCQKQQQQQQHQEQGQLVHRQRQAPQLQSSPSMQPLPRPANVHHHVQPPTQSSPSQQKPSHMQQQQHPARWQHTIIDLQQPLPLSCTAAEPLVSTPSKSSSNGKSIVPAAALLAATWRR